MFSSPASGSCCVIFIRLLVPALPFRSRLYKWNVVIEEKVQIGSSCKWSLVSGRRFLFRLCSQTGVWSFKGENHTSVTSGLSDPLTFSPRAGVWVTHYKTELSSPSLSCLPMSQKRNFNSWMLCHGWLAPLFSTCAQNCLRLGLADIEQAGKYDSATETTNKPLKEWRKYEQSGNFQLDSLKVPETNPEMQQPSSAVGDPSRWGPKARFISFQKEVHVCRLLL